MLWVVIAGLAAPGCVQDAGSMQENGSVHDAANAREVIRLQDIGNVAGADSGGGAARVGEADSTGGRGPARGPAVSDGSDVPYLSTPTVVVDSMLALAGVTADDVVYDLGSGDGRIPIRAAKQYGARGVGIEIRPDLVEEARQNAQAAGVADRVTFRQGDLFEADLSEATVVTLYLLPSVNVALRPKLLRELRPGARVVSRDFDMGEWGPDRINEVREATLYLWRIPAEPPAFADEQE